MSTLVCHEKGQKLAIAAATTFATGYEFLLLVSIHPMLFYIPSCCGVSSSLGETVSSLLLFFDWCLISRLEFSSSGGTAPYPTFPFAPLLTLTIVWCPLTISGSNCQTPHHQIQKIPRIQIRRNTFPMLQVMGCLGEQFGLLSRMLKRGLWSGVPPSQTGVW